jgi:ferrous iron transport protein B
MTTAQDILANKNNPAPHGKDTFTVALAGNPNCGKTSLFNALTGARQHVGNWPGVTVEKKEGACRHGDTNLHVVDLPGAYSLRAYSAEEIVTRDFVIRRRPDVVVNIVDCSNFERNLYLTTQLLELGVPLVLAFNMWDMAAQQHIEIDVSMLSQMFGVPIVPTVGVRGQGLDELLAAAVRTAADPKAALAARRYVDYGNEIEPHVQQLTDALVLALLLEPSPGLRGLLEHRRHLASQLLEGDAPTAELLREFGAAAVEPVIAQAAALAKHVERTLGRPCEIVLADRRYGFISGACAEALRRPPGHQHSRSDRIDAVITHPYLGLPIFALMMFLVFQLTFWLGNPLVDLLGGWKEALAQWVRAELSGPSTQLLRSLLADGIVEGVGAVVSFVPLILLLYLAIAVLEDSGYMSRAAFVLDRLMHRIGLHGKSFIPMLIGFGCTVPAVMATRILETRRDRLTTILVLPLMSCGARLGIYVLLLGAFFPDHAVLSLGPLRVTNQALLLMMLYVIGIVLAIACTKLLRVAVFRGEITPFVMELPPYRRPTVRSLATHTFERGWQYVQKAGTIILAIVVLLWAAKTWPGLPADQVDAFAHERQTVQAAAGDPAAVRSQLAQIDIREHRAQLTNSAIGRVGRFVAPVLQPAGFDWKIATAMLGALAVKEAFIGQMGVIYAVGDGDDAGQNGSLRQNLARDYSPLQGLALMLFVLIASPCMATVAVTARESGSWKWAALQWGYLTVLAWVVACGVFQVGHAMGFG